MMKVNVQHILTRTIQLLIFPVLMAACQLHEEPELTADGEWGVDPTEVNVDLNVRLTLSLPGQGEEEDAVGVLRVPSTNEYLRRFIVEAYLNRQPVARETFLEDITDRTHLTLPLNMKLHARNYQLLIWSDIVSAETPDEDLYYNTETLVPVIPNRSSHTGNTEYKDVFAASVPLDLTSYADQWGATVETDIELTRPVARYELIATDVEAFRQRIANGEVNGNRFTARMKYSGYVQTGYNVLDDVLKNSLMYMQYNTTIRLPEEGTEELRMGFDYVFANAGEASSIPMEVEIVDENQVTIANSVISVSCERGKNTILRDAFLTNNEQGGGDNPGGGDEGGGIGFDDEYDGEINIDVPMN